MEWAVRCPVAKTGNHVPSTQCILNYNPIKQLNLLTRLERFWKNVNEYLGKRDIRRWEM